MRPGGGRAKGHNFEKEVARVIGDWWCEDPLAFWRSAGSGSRVHTAPTTYSGDVVPVKDEALPWPLHVEAKKDENWTFDGFIKRKETEPLYSHMAQCMHDLKKAERLGMLICSRNHDAWYIFLPAHQWGFMHFTKTIMRLKTYYVPRAVIEKYGCHTLDFWCIEAKDFFEIVTRKEIMTWLEWTEDPM